jgi:hypothetical protein
MRKALALVLALLLATPVLALGPSLSAPANVVVVDFGVDEASPGWAEICGSFRLSNAQARRFLSRAAIVTRPELHDYFDVLPCFVRGTAEFGGYLATWEIRAGGTGTVTLTGGESFPIVDRKHGRVVK